MTGEKSESDGFKLVFSKDAFVLLPLIGTALAVIYDVGFFSGIGPAYFTVFSLSEHIIFALYFLPFAIIVTAIFVLYVYFTGPWEAPETTRRAFAKPNRLKLFAALLVSAPFAAWAVYHIFFDDPKLVPTFIAFTVSFVALVISINRSLLIKFVCGLLAATVCVFVVGYQVGTRPARPVAQTATTIELKDGKQIPARIVRTGDRGILFFDATGAQLSLLRWDQVRQIVTKQNQ